MLVNHKKKHAHNPHLNTYEDSGRDKQELLQTTDKAVACGGRFREQGEGDRRREQCG